LHIQIYPNLNERKFDDINLLFLLGTKFTGSNAKCATT